MKLRLASAAFFFSALATGLCWLTLQPLLMRLLETLAKARPGGEDGQLIASARLTLPLLLAFDFISIFLVSYAVLYWTLGRQLRETEHVVEQMGRLELDVLPQISGGPLLSRLHVSLRRTAEALKEERAVTARQLSELASANASLSKAQIELVAAERLAMVGELAAGIAHEVGNPLSGILGYLSIAQSRAREQPELLDCLNRSEAELQRISEIVRSLLELGRPAQGRPTPTDLRNLVENCSRLVRANRAFRDVTVDSHIPEGFLVLAEPGPLSQVLLNLFLNAAQAMNGSGRISLTVVSVTPRVQVALSDTGPGVPFGVRDQLFKPFFTTKAAGTGTGLGLAVSRHLMRSMNGELGLSTQATGGATFILELPGTETLPSLG